MTAHAQFLASHHEQRNLKYVRFWFWTFQWVPEKSFLYDLKVKKHSNGGIAQKVCEDTEEIGRESSL